MFVSDLDTTLLRTECYSCDIVDWRRSLAGQSPLAVADGEESDNEADKILDFGQAYRVSGQCGGSRPVRIIPRRTCPSGRSGRPASSDRSSPLDKDMP
jgi:hypothetical protein